MRRGILFGLLAVGLAACGTRGAPAATATNAVLAAGTSPLATAPAATATVPAPAATLARTSTPLPAASPSAEAPTAEPGLPTVSGDPLLRTYRSMVAIQVNAALVAETVRQVQAGRLDPEEMPVAALALGALTQSVDEGVTGVAPPPALDAQWQAALAQHAQVKALGARWALGVVDVGDVSSALTPIQADLERLLAEADAAVASQYGVQAAELTEYRQKLVAAVGSVLE
jgi:hypothetical protein